MSGSIPRWFGEWRHPVQKPVSAEEVERVVERGSIPSYAFYFMLTMSAVIATFGLLANSAAVIIGAMIVAPLMSPIISVSYGIVAGRGRCHSGQSYLAGRIDDRPVARTSARWWFRRTKRAFILPRIDAPIVNLNIYFFDHRVGFDRGLTSSYSRAG